MITRVSESQSDQSEQLTRRSLIVVSCGTVRTHAYLFGTAEEHFRLLAHTETATTASAPFSDVSIGIRLAIQSLEQISGRILFGQGRIVTPETVNGDGVDGFVLLTTLGGPLRVLTIGQSAKTCLPILQRAVNPIPGELYAQVQDGSPLLPGLRPLIDSARTPPHALVLVGHSTLSQSAETLADDLQEVRTYLETMSARIAVPAVFIIGNAEDIAIARQALPSIEVVGLEDLNTHQELQSHLQHVYEQTILSRIPGMNHAGSWATIMPGSIPAAMGRVTRFFGQRYGLSVLLIDAGATSTMIAHSTIQGSLSISRPSLAGLRLGAGVIVRESGWDSIAQWLPYEMSEDAGREAILQRMLHPHMVAETARDMAFDAALARESIRMAWTQGLSGSLQHISPPDMIIATGGFTAHLPFPSIAALILLDSIQPHGLTSLMLDDVPLFVAAGGVSYLERIGAVDTIDMDALHTQLGACLSTVGTPQPGQPALHIHLNYSNGRQSDAAISPNMLTLIPLGIGQRAYLSIYPAAGVDIGLGAGVPAQLGSPVEGGLLGFIVDTRGRPLILPKSPQQRIALLQQWYQALGIPQ